MRVVLSNLAARYHEKDGWERKVLAGYVEHKPRGGDGLVANDFDRPGTTYYILEVGARMNIKKILEDFDINLDRGRSADKGTVAEVLESRNW